MSHTGVLSPMVVQVSNALSARTQQIIRITHTWVDTFGAPKRIQADLVCNLGGAAQRYLNDGPALWKTMRRITNASGPNARVVSWFWMDAPQFSVIPKHPRFTFQQDEKLLRFQYPARKLKRTLRLQTQEVLNELDFYTSIQASVPGQGPTELAVLSWDVDQRFGVQQVRRDGPWVLQAGASSSVPLRMLTGKQITPQVVANFSGSVACPYFIAPNFYNGKTHTWTFSSDFWQITLP